MTSANVVSILIAAGTGALMLLLPHFSPRRFFFAITVPPGFPATEAGRASLRRYEAFVIISIALSMLAAVAFRSQEWALMLPVALPLFTGFAAFLRERSVVRRYSAPDSGIREASLTAADDHLPGWIWLALPPFVFPIAITQYLRAHWDEIPPQYPVHWDLQGNPNGWVTKTSQGVFGMQLYQAAILLVLLLLGIAIFYGSRRMPQRRAMLGMLIAAMYMSSLMYGGIAIMPMKAFAPVWWMMPTIAYVAVMIVWSYRMARRMPAESTPDSAWHLGSFYYNPDDPAIFVQKRIGFGYTFNFGNRVTWGIVGIMVAVFGGLMFMLPQG